MEIKVKIQRNRQGARVYTEKFPEDFFEVVREKYIYGRVPEYWVYDPKSGWEGLAHSPEVEYWMKKN